MDIELNISMDIIGYGNVLDHHERYARAVEHKIKATYVNANVSVQIAYAATATTCLVTHDYWDDIKKHATRIATETWDKTEY